MNNSLVKPSGFIEQENDCYYSLNNKSTPARENAEPDTQFYFDNYIAPRYGLHNLNANNFVSFVKDFEMNWTKIPENLRCKLLNLMLDIVFKQPEMFECVKDRFTIVKNVTTNNCPTQPPPPPPPEPDYTKFKCLILFLLVLLILLCIYFLFF